MKTKHTPGPWFVTSQDCVSAKGRLIADCEHTSHANRPSPPYAEDMANAALIAAAPELLDALEAAMEANRLAFNALNTDRYGHSLSGRTEKEIARMALYEAKNDYAMAAIAKARGE